MINKQYFERIKKRFLSTKFDDLIWLVDIIPKMFGFSLHKDRISAFFWIFHCFLMFYIYALGNLHYLLYFAKGSSDYLACYVNVSIIILTMSDSYWWLTKRPLLRSILAISKESDELVSPRMEIKEQKHNLIKPIRRIVLLFYGFVYASEVQYCFCRVGVENDYAMTPCLGFNLNSTVQRLTCNFLQFSQEMTITIVVLNYQALFMVLIGHTAAMYQLLSEELVRVKVDRTVIPTNTMRNEDAIKINAFIRRHCLILEIVSKLRSLYSMPMGVNFGYNVVSLMLIFCSDFNEMYKFIPLLIYSFSLFFLYCFLCQKILNAAETFQQAIYNSGWESSDVKLRNSIYFMLLASQKKPVLLAADIFPINIATFASSCQLIYKFATVVKVNGDF